MKGLKCNLNLATRSCLNERNHSIFCYTLFLHRIWFNTVSPTKLEASSLIWSQTLPLFHRQIDRKVRQPSWQPCGKAKPPASSHSQWLLVTGWNHSFPQLPSSNINLFGPFSHHLTGDFKSYDWISKSWKIIMECGFDLRFEGT